MKRLHFTDTQFLGLAVLGLFSSSCSQKNPVVKPNIIYILADDLGYNELGCYGQEKIRTPHIDQLAAEGIRFTNHYSGSAVSAPSRCSLLSGMHQGHAYIRGNDEVGEWYDYTGQLPLPDSIFTLGELMQEAGYVTGAIGKWGLGNIGEGHPNNQGFDYFYGYLCQRQAHNYFPTYLWENQKRDSLGNTYFKPHQKLSEGIDIPENYKQFNQGVWAAEKMTEKSLQFIEQNKDKPFFLFLPTPIPHVSLQMPDSLIASYGYDFEETPYNNTKGYTPNYKPRATYAAMISYMDDYVGQVMAALKENGLDDNTIVMFSSDNGATYAGGVDYEFFESVGSLKGLKGELYEGGIRVPFIVRWPGQIEAGVESDHISAFWDIMPTMAELTLPEKMKGYDGISFLPNLLGDKEQVQHEYLYWEFHERDHGVQAVRMGKWKALRKNAHEDPNSPIELYNLDMDSNEQVNVADDNPEIIDKIWEIFHKEHTPSNLNNWRFIRN